MAIGLVWGLSTKQAIEIYPLFKRFPMLYVKEGQGPCHPAWEPTSYVKNVMNSLGDQTCCNNKSGRVT